MPKEYKKQWKDKRGIKFSRSKMAAQGCRGRKWHNYPDGFKPKRQVIYRNIWEAYNGPIPEGMFIHHIDGDNRNHAIENLQLVVPGQHLKIHRARGDWNHKDPRSISGLNKAQKKARAWHSSPEGRAWHRKHAKKTGFGTRDAS